MDMSQKIQTKKMELTTDVLHEDFHNKSDTPVDAKIHDLKKYFDKGFQDFHSSVMKLFPTQIDPSNRLTGNVYLNDKNIKNNEEINPSKFQNLLYEKDIPLTLNDKQQE